jgi:hypothetical protein
MKLKTIEVSGKTYAELSDGKPIYVHDDGKEIAVDAPANIATISRLSGEAKAHRERAEKAEGDLKEFHGIEDPEAARKAIETLANLDAGKLLTAGKVDEIKVAAKRAAEEQVAAANKANADELAKARAEKDQLAAQLHATMIGGGFARSKLITDDKHPMRLVLPADVAESRFGKNFKVEDGKVVGYDNHNNKIFSRAKPGELADFDEAFEALIEVYPYKDQILRGTGNKGDGARPNNGGAMPKTMPQSEFNKLPAKERAARMAAGMTLTDA